MTRRLHFLFVNLWSVCQKSVHDFLATEFIARGNFELFVEIDHLRAAAFLSYQIILLM